MAGVRAFTAGFKGVRKIGEVGARSGELHWLLVGVRGAAPLAGLLAGLGPLLTGLQAGRLVGLLVGLVSRSAMAAASILPGLKRGPALGVRRALASARGRRGEARVRRARWVLGVSGAASPAFSFLPLAGVRPCLAGDPPQRTFATSLGVGVAAALGVAASFLGLPLLLGVLGSSGVSSTGPRLLDDRRTGAASSFTVSTRFLPGFLAGSSILVCRLAILPPLQPTPVS